MKTIRKIANICALVAIAVSCGKPGDEPEKDVKYPEGLTILTPELSLYGDSGSAEVVFASSSDWTVTSDEDWIEVYAEGNGSRSRENRISLKVKDYPSGDERIGTVNVIGGDAFEVIIVRQSAISKNSVTSFLRNLYQMNRDEYTHVAICAHRANTYSGTYVLKNCPENSIPAILHCGELGIEMVELDVRKTSDGVLVLGHDDKLSSVTEASSGTITGTTYADLQKLNMKIRENGTIVPGVHIPSLHDALLAAKKAGVWVNLDLEKMTIPIGELYSVIEETGMLDGVTCYVGGSDKVDAGKNLYNYKNNHRLSIHLSVNQGSACTSLASLKSEPLFQLSTGYYWDGSTAATKVSSGIHKMGFCSFSNMLNYDQFLHEYNSSTYKGLDALDAFIKAKIDIMQTDVADSDVIQFTLAENDLRTPCI